MSGTKYLVYSHLDTQENKAPLRADGNEELVCPGKLSIGSNSNPAAALDITGTLGITGNTVISGDLNVDTNTLVVDSTNNRVGINKASPAKTLDVVGDMEITDDSDILGTLTLSKGAGSTGLDVTADATIGGNLSSTGDLVVATNTVAVNATSSSVGIGVATPQYGKLDVRGHTTETTTLYSTLGAPVGGDSISTSVANYTAHVFLQSGTFEIFEAGTFDIFLVGGGGAGGQGAWTGGGGGGEVKTVTGQAFQAGTHTITVGAGGVTVNGAQGGTSSIYLNGVLISSANGGFSPTQAQVNAGTGGTSGNGTAGGTGNPNGGAGGGGGQGGVGSNGSVWWGGHGGAQVANNWRGNNVFYYSGGGGGGNNQGGSGQPDVDNGFSSGGQGGTFASTSPTTGTANTGGGGGGSDAWSNGQAGGSGIVMIRYGTSVSATGVSIYFSNSTSQPVPSGKVSIAGEFGVRARSVGFLLDSDSRIKKDIQDISDGAALNLIRQLQPKTYKYKNANVSNSVYGFLAQDVKSVLPHSVFIKPDFIPDIFRTATVTNGNTLTLAAHDLIKGSYISLKNPDKIVRIISVPNADTFTIDESLNVEHVTVYGTFVEDYHTLNKDAIWTVSTAALQEVDRQLEAEKTKAAALETKYQMVKNDLATIKAYIGL